MNPTTYGKFPCAKVLVSLLEEREDSKLTRRVSRHLYRTINGYIALDEIDNDKWFKYFSLLWKKEQDNFVSFGDALVDEYVRTLLTTIYREWVYGPKELRAS